ncbi:hypothetical protein [Mycobacterium intracellulare]|uniref:hypothetical protein n=1 Tax=Mycobacterium intracellulare TaxID=1767 RepID=UPI001CDA08A3|nr:hypothetical protein [Mycobacterium intracellulare]
MSAEVPDRCGPSTKRATGRFPAPTELVEVAAFSTGLVILANLIANPNLSLVMHLSDFQSLVDIQGFPTSVHARRRAQQSFGVDTIAPTTMSAS